MDWELIVSVGLSALVTMLLCGVSSAMDRLHLLRLIKALAASRHETLGVTAEYLVNEFGLRDRSILFNLKSLEREGIISCRQYANRKLYRLSFVEDEVTPHRVMKHDWN